MDTPGPIRGQFYTTHLTTRCPNYKQCKACIMCENYNPHNPFCGLCEFAKPKNMRHSCSAKRIEGVILMEEITGMPRFSPNPKPQDAMIDVCTTSFDPQKKELIDRLHRLVNDQNK